jgi:hypothetical protein
VVTKTYYSCVWPGFVAKQGVSDAHPVAGFVVVAMLPPERSANFPVCVQNVETVTTPPSNIVGAVQYWVPLLTLKAKAPPTTARTVKDASINFTLFIKEVLFNSKS